MGETIAWLATGICVICAFAGYGIGDQRGNAWAGALFGLTLGPLGLAITLTLPTHTGPRMPAGWYEDPWQPDRHRWWDGSTWTPLVELTTADATVVAVSGGAEDTAHAHPPSS